MKAGTKKADEDGVYHIGGAAYEILRGTRVDVWNGRAYQTTGGVPKSGLIINRNGKIVSKIKSVEGYKNNRFEMRINENKSVNITAPLPNKCMN